MNTTDIKISFSPIGDGRTNPVFAGVASFENHFIHAHFSLISKTCGTEVRKFLSKMKRASRRN